MASQALLVVLAPTIDAIAHDFRASIGAVAQARSISAAVAVVSAAMIMPHLDVAHISRLLRRAVPWGRSRARPSPQRPH
jgi:predicted MFS family arabinose efflux permease